MKTESSIKLCQKNLFEKIRWNQIMSWLNNDWIMSGNFFQADIPSKHMIKVVNENILDYCWESCSDCVQS